MKINLLLSVEQICHLEKYTLYRYIVSNEFLEMRFIYLLG